MKLCKALTSILVLAMVCALGGQGLAGGDKKDETYIKVDVKGKLETGIMAPGAETTGVIIRTETMTLELDCGKDKELRALADKLNNQTALVTGTLTLRQGVAVKTRYIVHVTTLKAADSK
jgi:hypothetical protein